MACLRQAFHLGRVLLPHSAFQERAAYPIEWSAALNSKGSERTCIRSGLPTFLHDAFTAHSDFVVKSQAVDIIELLLEHMSRPHGVHLACRHRTSRGELLAMSEDNWSTT